MTWSPLVGFAPKPPMAAVIDSVVLPNDSGTSKLGMSKVCVPRMGISISIDGSMATEPERSISTA